MVGGVIIVLFTIDFYYCVSQRHITLIEIFRKIYYTLLYLLYCNVIKNKISLRTKGTPIDVKENKCCISNYHYFNKRNITPKYPAKYTRSEIFFRKILVSNILLMALCVSVKAFILQFITLDAVY